MKKLYCVNLYKGLRVANTGRYQFCCKSEQDLTDNTGNVANIETHDMLDVMNGKKAIEIRTALENGEYHENCVKCWAEEAGGIKSKRQHDSIRSIDYWGKEYLQDNTINPEIVEFNLGTVCNLKCRICGPWSSSFWSKEYKDLELPKRGVDLETYKEKLKYWAGNWEETSPAWDNIEKYISKMKKIDIFGGEPFLVEKQWKLLKKCVENNWCKTQSLHFNTNGTQYNDEYINLLPEFERVWISASIDGISDQFEYQRHPAKWDLVLQNLQKFKKLSDTYSNITLSVCITVNIQNVFYVPDIMEYFKKMGIVCYLNYCHWPTYYCVKHIPESIKDKIIEKYENYKDPWISQCLQDITGLMKSQICDGNQWKEFINKVRETDEYRNENFCAVFPEFSQLIGYTKNESY